MPHREEHLRRPVNAGGRTGFLALCGIGHQSATLSEREPFHICRKDLGGAVTFFKGLPGVNEVVLVATCNRLEAYMVLDAGVDAFGVMKAFLFGYKGIDAQESRHLFYQHHGSTVARRLFRVVAGLDSLVFGEYQIASQVKEAYSAACSSKGAGKVLHKLFHLAFRAGKRVRSKTTIGGGQYSVAGVTLRLLKERLDRHDPVLLIGINESIQIVAEGLRAAGFERLIFANRTAVKAQKLASRCGGGEWSSLEDLPGLLARCRGLVSCTAAPGAVITAAHWERCLDAARPGLGQGRTGPELVPKLVVDMAVPRDVEVVGKLADIVRIVDLEDLKHLLDNQERDRLAELPAAQSLIEDVVTSFQVWMEHAFDPGVANLAKEYERIRQKCLEEARVHFGSEDQEALERFSRQIMQSFLKVPARTFLDQGRQDSKPQGLCRLKKDLAATSRTCNPINATATPGERGTEGNETLSAAPAVETCTPTCRRNEEEHHAR